MAIKEEYKKKIQLREKILNFKINILRILTLPARKKFFLAKQFSVFCNKFYDEYNDADTCPSRGLFKLIDLISIEEELLLIDVGASRGYISNYFLQKHAKFKAICIEPFNSAFKKLTNNLEKFNLNTKRVFFIKKAMNDIKTEKDFYYSKKYTGSLTNSLEFAEEHYKDEGHFGKETFQADTLDNTIDELKINFELIDLLKIDVEGSEENVLKGFKKYLKKTSLIIIEYSHFNLLNDFPLKKIYKEYGKSFYIGRISNIKPYIKISEKYNFLWDDFKCRNLVLINKDRKNHKTADFLLKNSIFI